MQLLLLASCLLGQTGDSPFAAKALVDAPLQARVLKATEQDGIVLEEVRFHSHRDGEKTIDVFGYFAYPKKGGNHPAFVWNQGGLYQATPHFPLLGARRGYAVLCIDFPLPGYRTTGGYPITSGLELPDDPKKAPIYHGAVALLRAVSYLQSRGEVDPERIGMAGSSWGGFYTTLMSGIDPRLKACSSMFGCGFLDAGNAWWDGAGPQPRFDAAFRKRWADTLDPGRRLTRTRTPLAIFTGTNDSFYWLPAVDATYLAAAGPKHLALLPNWNHALTPALDDQVFGWLDVHLRKGTPFLGVADLQMRAGKETEATWRVTGAGKVKRAWLHVSFGPPGNWVSRPWLDIPARIEGNVCRAVLPRYRTDALVLASIEDAQGRRSSTGMVAVEGDPQAARLVPDYDGCRMWGSFGDEQVEFCKLHGHPLPKFVEVAGKRVAAFPAGKHVLPPLLATAGVPHELRIKQRLSGPGRVAWSLHAASDGKKTTLDLPAPAEEASWREIAGRATLPPGKSTSLRLHLTVPPGLTVQVERVELRPVGNAR